MNLSNNTILIIGGTSGIGAALLDYFYKKGNSIICIASNELRLQALKSKYSEIHIKRCDLGNKQEVQELIHYLQLTHPEINILINNAAIEENYNLGDNIDENRILDEIQINLSSPILLINGLKKSLINHKQAAIINVTSALIYQPKINAAVYSATKAGLHHFTLALREQFSQTNIKVFELIPPLTDTPLTQNNPNKKLSVEKLIKEFVKAIEKDKLDIHVGQSKWIKLLNKISPNMLMYILKRRAQNES